MAKLTPAQMKAAIEAFKSKISLNIGRNVGDKVDALTNKQIEDAIKLRFPGASITSHEIIPAQPNTAFGPFEPTSRVTIQASPSRLKDQVHGLSEDLQQQAIPSLNHTTGDAVLAGPEAAGWGGKFDKNYFVHPGSQTAHGNRLAEIEQFKNQFAPGFYHGSPANDIVAFDPLKSAKDPMYITPKATFVTRDPEFAESFLSMNNNGKMKSGSTMYPVSVNLGQHWHPNTPEGKQVISDFIEKYPKRVNLERGLNKGDWTAVENSDFLSHLKDTGHDTFHVMEGGVPNVGVFEPQNIRGKFADYNPDEATNPDFMKAAGGLIHLAGGGRFGQNGPMQFGQNGSMQFGVRDIPDYPQEIPQKAEGGVIDSYAPGGAVVKKFLEHARSTPFVHYSTSPNISRLEPTMYGSGIKGAEAARLKDAPDIKPRSYFYVDKGSDTMRPEQGLGPHKYQGVAEDIYPLHEDPAGYSAIAKLKALDPYMMSFGREVVDQPTHLNELERLIKGAGYKGYADDNVGLLFHPTEVQKVTE